MKIGFWHNRDGNFRTAQAGLNAEQVAFLQSLKVGDPLVLWNEGEVKSKDSQPDLRLGKGRNV